MISVIVPTRGRAHLLAGLVEAFDGDPQVLEIVVVVDGVDASSMRVLDGLASGGRRLVVLNPSRCGQLGALDHGLARARGDVVLLLDDDVLPGPMLASGHAAYHREREGLVVVGSMPVRLSQNGRDPVGTRLYAEEYRGQCDRLERGEVDVLDSLWLGNVSLRRADGERVGLRSEGFPVFYHSDRDLGYRLADAGMTGVYAPELRATHLHRRGMSAFLRDAQRQGAGREALARVHAARSNPVAPADPSGAIGGAAAAAVRLIGSTRLARPVALGLMTAGGVSGRLGAPGLEVAAARSARRVMLRRGSVTGEE